MAQRVQVVLEDDIDGSVADETVSFSLDGSSYEIDLGRQHAEELRAAVAPWLGFARKVGGRARRNAATTNSSTNAGPARTDAGQLSAIRRWAQENGHEVSSRGRIPAAIQEAYQSAHQRQIDPQPASGAAGSGADASPMVTVSTQHGSTTDRV